MLAYPLQTADSTGFASASVAGPEQIYDGISSGARCHHKTLTEAGFVITGKKELTLRAPQNSKQPYWFQYSRGKIYITTGHIKTPYTMIEVGRLMETPPFTYAN